MDWLMGFPLTAQGFDQVQVHVDYLSSKVYAVPYRSTDTTADAAKHILDMALRSGDGRFGRGPRSQVYEQPVLRMHATQRLQPYHWLRVPHER